MNDTILPIVNTLLSLNGITFKFNMGHVGSFLSIVLMLSASLWMILRSNKKEDSHNTSDLQQEISQAREVSEKIDETYKPKEPNVVKVTWKDRLKKGLNKSRNEVWSKLENLLGGNQEKEQMLENIEEVLYTADLGHEIVELMLTELKEKYQKDWNVIQVKTFLYDFLFNQMTSLQGTIDKELYHFKNSNEQNSKRPKIILVVGVNGAGKTTTIGKLATKLSSQGAKVVVGAADTFRAAAVDQLEVWCERANATIIKGKENADPSGVVYETVQKAINEKADYCIIDTAGRLQVKVNLMKELEKNKNVIKKLVPEGADETLLVIDSITGQNAMSQAKEFNKYLGVTGLVFTKCDGSAKAGHAVSITKELKVPIVYIGVGEQVEDLELFNLNDYLEALLDFERV